MRDKSLGSRRLARAAAIATTVSVSVVVCTACADTRDARGAGGPHSSGPDASSIPDRQEWRSHDVNGVRFSAPKDARVRAGTPLENTSIEIETTELSLQLHAGPLCLSNQRPIMGARQEEVVVSAVRGEISVWKGDTAEFPIEAEARVQLTRDECVSARGRGRSEHAYAEMKQVFESVVVSHVSK